MCRERAHSDDVRSVSGVGRSSNSENLVVGTLHHENGPNVQDTLGGRESFDVVILPKEGHSVEMIV